MKFLIHEGTKRHSGRYPWGSGKNPEQRDTSSIGYANELKKKGFSEVDQAKSIGLNTAQLRKQKSLIKTNKILANQAEANKLFDKGMSKSAIARQMGIPEPTVRLLLNKDVQKRTAITNIIADMLRENVEKKQYIDVGIGIERHLGISREKLKNALFLLQKEGYLIRYSKVNQLGTGKDTSLMVLTKDDAKHIPPSKVKFITDYSDDGGRNFSRLEPIRSISSKNILIRYAEDGGKEKDGVIELRRNVPELNLGEKRYAQVRIGVDDTHYMKGMAMYTNEVLPKGIDVIYNSNKKRGTPQEKVFKAMETNPEKMLEDNNPFGSLIRQNHYEENGVKKLSALNKMGAKEGAGEEGAWGEWSKTLSAQMLSKQRTSLAKEQLSIAYDIKKEEYDDIMANTNPTVKKKLLATFADAADSAAVHLKAAAMPRQTSNVILPLTDIKETEIYAPNYTNGEKVILIRYPHGGLFEIPELTVNNKKPSHKELIGPADDAVGIHPKVAEKLSGADFDGDTVIVIPNPLGNLKSRPALDGLKNFDPKLSYPERVGMTYMTNLTKGRQMGEITNLITDMTIKGANDNELTRAIKHSMVVIDAFKWKLDFKKSFDEQQIASLKKFYQGAANKGASTLLSKAASKQQVGDREDGIFVTDPITNKKKKMYIDPITGQKLYTYKNESYTNYKTGKVTTRMIDSTKMYETDDAFTLSSGTPMEAIYATHANKLKALGNQARKDYLVTPNSKWVPNAKEVYKQEVDSLTAQLHIALRNAPLERQAQIVGNMRVQAKKDANPNLEYSELKKIKGIELVNARNIVGAGKEKITISDKEWEAIQAGALSSNIVAQILENTDLERIKQLSTPRLKSELSPAKILLVKSMNARGYSNAEIAERIGVSTAKILTYL